MYVHFLFFTKIKSIPLCGEFSVNYEYFETTPGDVFIWLFCHFQFLYPLPRQQGYEFMIQQFDGHMINFTPLIAFQVKYLIVICQNWCN